MRKYCDKCGKEVETKIVTLKESYEVYGEMIEVDAQVLVCAECGEELYYEDLDKQTLLHVYNEYRKRHKLLSPNEIKEIREQYGLSQRSFAKLLNWGDKTIFRYENGSIQDKAHNSILLFLRNPENMKTYLMENEVTIDEKKKNKILEKIKLLEKEIHKETDNQIFDLYFGDNPCIENGFKRFDYKKVCAIVSYFANKNSELLKTKLMKLLNYSDMIFYKENGVSLSGLKYIHYPYGPVPQNFDMLLNKMTIDHIIHVDVVYENGYEKHQVVPEENDTNDILTNEEIKILDKVYEKFKNYGSAEISEYSHKEKGYTSTELGQIISYGYAKDINLN